jgi:hypothetical protein
VFVLLAGLAFFGWWKLGRPFDRKSAHPRQPHGDEVNAGQPAAPRLARRRVIASVSTATEIGWRNWRTPGDRLLGIHRVDAVTGGPISVRSAVVRRLVTDLCPRLIGDISHSSTHRNAEALKSLAPILDDIRKQHTDDQEAMHRAITAATANGSSARSENAYCRPQDPSRHCPQPCGQGAGKRSPNAPPESSSSDTAGRKTYEDPPPPHS